MKPPFESFREDNLDRAVRAVIDAPVPPGPSPMLMERTRAAIRRGGSGGSWVVRGSWRWAAIVLIAASAATVVALKGPAVVERIAGNDKPAPVAPGSGVAAPAHLAVVGFVKLEGAAPLPHLLPQAGGPHCGHNHAPPRDESIVVAANGGLANVIVSVSSGLPEGRSYQRPAAPAVLDQRDCKYTPRMVVMQVGQELVAKNSDPFFHNVHTNSMRNKPVNVAQPQPDPVGLKLKSVVTAETFKVTCDLHPWMIAWVAAFDHPFYGVTGDDGAFTMPALPPGQYTLKAWHERLGAIEQQVVVGTDGKLPPVQLKFGAERLAAALADRNVTVDAGHLAKPACCK
ncbi:carboxypeptidase regulatory-like domain-containing protein [Humisphaera borealis]|uniref:Rhamnogalacturonan lyase domain-containing protein n=1 Tax=Humisphaera borealis TaxID=2807512 RepID=A0A7M2X0I6_9BACT|nr:carboxypeptidase regulatory-like domain-containing protein [Humisphaera borealis]QOV90611.1 hypothetical protein IPV69_04400 [Humisphaera borealis]